MNICGSTYSSCRFQIISLIYRKPAPGAPGAAAHQGHQLYTKCPLPPRSLPGACRRPPRSDKTAQEAPKAAQDTPKRGPRALREGPRELQETPTQPRTVPRWPQVASRRYTGAPRRSQRLPRGSRRGFQEANFIVFSMVFEGFSGSHFFRPRIAQNGPRGSKFCPQTAQEAP